MQSQVVSEPDRCHLGTRLGFLVIASLGLSLTFACAAPLAAFSAIAALTSVRRNSVILIGAIWCANQLVGYGYLGYPATLNSCAWAAALGLAVLLATLTARAVGGYLAVWGRTTAGLGGFVAAFATYEATLFAISAGLLGGVENFSTPVMGRILAINVMALPVLLALDRLGAILRSSRIGALLKHRANAAPVRPAARYAWSWTAE